MAIWRQLARGLRSLVNRRAAQRDLSDEIRDYVERATAAHMERGLSAADARRAVRLEMGDGTSVGEQVRSSGWEHVIETTASDVRHALQRLLGTPAFTVIVVATLALGIGMTTAIVAVVRAILFAAPAYPDVARVVVVAERRADGSQTDGTYGMYRWFVDRSRSFESLAVARTWAPSLTGVGMPQRLTGQRVTARYFDVLGIPVVIGRGFLPTDDRPGDPLVVVMSHRLWRTQFGSDPAIVGRRLSLNGATYTVIGVMPAGFENVLLPDADVWTTLQYSLSDGRAWGHHVRTIGRLRQGVGVREASAEVETVGQSALRELNPETYAPDTRFAVATLPDEIARGVRGTLLTILGAVALLLLIACVNVTNLMLTRTMQRRAEFALRTALGAGRLRLVRQVIVESVVLAAIGGIAGLAVANAAIRTVVALAGAALPRLDAIGLDLPVYLIAFAITALAGIAVGLMPALRIARATPQADLLRASPRTVGGHRRTRQVLVATQVAVALMLLVGSGLLLRSLQQLLAVPAGFDASRLLTMQVQTVGPRFADPALAAQTLQQMADAVQAVPGVRSVAMTSQLPLSGDFDAFGVYFELDPARGFNSFRYAVTPGYFETMRIPLRAGRYLDARDRAGVAPSAVISESLAARRFGNAGAALGQRLRIGPPDGPWFTVAGVVGDLKQLSLEAAAADAVYSTVGQWVFADRSTSLVVRAEGDIATLAPAVRDAVWSVDRNQPVVRIAQMGELVAATTADRRLALTLLEFFALAALLLAAAGIYGILATTVVERTREIGVRAALGATRASIVSLIVRQGLTMTGAGVILGLAGAAALSGAMASLLFGVSRVDAITYASVVAMIAAVSLLASAIPAWRAARLDPAMTLRAE
jgi:putative ABC transport system permease protein